MPATTLRPFTGPDYHEPSTRDARERIIEFFKVHLRSAPSPERPAQNRPDSGSTAPPGPQAPTSRVDEAEAGTGESAAE